MKKLPISIQTFPDIIADGYCYVDKTPFVHQLVENGKYYFQSRPRRFGKSLLVSTLKSAFLGQKALFNGLYLENHWNWKIQHPVISISFGRGNIESRTILDTRIDTLLKENSEQYEIELENQTMPDKFAELIQKLHRKYQQRVVIQRFEQSHRYHIR